MNVWDRPIEEVKKMLIKDAGLTKKQTKDPLFEDQIQRIMGKKTPTVSFCEAELQFEAAFWV